MKHNLRKTLLTLRMNLDPDYVKQASKKIFANFAIFLKQKAFTSIATYYPIKFELDILPLNKALFKQGVELALPHITKQNPMTFRKWEADAKLIWQNNFYQPPNSAKIIKPQLIIVPLLGFNRCGYRLGYGQGFYDQLLEVNPDAYKVALAYSKQAIMQLPVEEHDQPVDLIITESELIVCKQ
jgi:5-formyltetrahydrofolate cyclo-ligase